MVPIRDNTSQVALPSLLPRNNEQEKEMVCDSEEEEDTLKLEDDPDTNKEKETGEVVDPIKDFNFQTDGKKQVQQDIYISYFLTLFS